MHIRTKVCGESGLRRKLSKDGLSCSLFFGSFLFCFEAEGENTMMAKRLVACTLAAALLVGTVETDALNVWATDVQTEEIDAEAVSDDGEEELEEEEPEIVESDLSEVTSEVEMIEDSNNDAVTDDAVVSFAGGDGTKENPYQVSTPEQLDAVRNDLSAYYVLVNDIDLSGVDYWLSIGDRDNYFSGGLDGQNYSISYMRFADKTVANKSTGLFCRIRGAEIKNLKLNNVEIKVYDSCGSIANISEFSTIANCDIEGYIYGIGDYGRYVGGVVGSAKYGEISNCSFSGYVQGQNSVGGIAGYNDGCEISYCECLPSDSYNLIDGSLNTGGIVGQNRGRIIKCQNKTEIHGNSWRSMCVGGIAGFNSGTISSCCNYGKIGSVSASDGQVGGVCGDNDYNIRSCFNFGNVSSDKAVVYGVTAHGNITCCYNIGNLHSENNKVYGGTSDFSNTKWCYYLNTVTESGEGTCLTDSAMHNKESFIGFDFEKVWAIDESINDGFPYLIGVDTGENNSDNPSDDKYDINECLIAIAPETFIYDGTEKRPSVSISAPNDDPIIEAVTLVEGKDFTVEYKNNTEIGTATVIIKGIGNYTGEVTKSFEITKAPEENPSTDGFLPSKDGWGFSNKEYTDDIPEELFFKVFDKNKMKNHLIYAWNKGKIKGGSCEGMSISSALHFLENPPISTWGKSELMKAYDFKTRDDHFQAYSKDLNVTLVQFIECMYTYQFSKVASKQVKDTKNDYQRIVDAVNNFAETKKNPIAICVRGWLYDEKVPIVKKAYKAHSLLPYKTQKIGNSNILIYVYDSNDPGNNNRYITLTCNDDKITGWSYPIRGAITWGSDEGGYIAYEENFESLASLSGNLNGDDSAIMTSSATNFSITAKNGFVVRYENGIYSGEDDTDIIPVPVCNIGEDDSSLTATMYLDPDNSIKVTNNDTDDVATSYANNNDSIQITSDGKSSLSLSDNNQKYDVEVTPQSDDSVKITLETIDGDSIEMSGETDSKVSFTSESKNTFIVAGYDNYSLKVTDSTGNTDSITKITEVSKIEIRQNEIVVSSDMDNDGKYDDVIIKTSGNNDASEEKSNSQTQKNNNSASAKTPTASAANRSSSNNTSSSSTFGSASSSGSSSSGSSSSSKSNTWSGGKGSAKGEFVKTSKTTVRYEAADGKTDSKILKVPATIKHGKKTYKVTSIAPYAFTGYDKLESVIVGKNVKKIGKNAFDGCEKLKTLAVRSKKLTAKNIKGSLGKSAVKTVVVPTDVLDIYRIVFTKKNTGSSGKLTVKAQK